jgi:hypothetical protein
MVYCNAAFSQVLALRHSRSMVREETCRQSAISSVLNPPKNLSSPRSGFSADQTLPVCLEPHRDGDQIRSAFFGHNYCSLKRQSVRVATSFRTSMRARMVHQNTECERGFRVACSEGPADEVRHTPKASVGPAPTGHLRSGCQQFGDVLT